MKNIVDTVRGVDCAKSLSGELAKTANDYRGHVVYVKLPDGSIVTGYDLEAETLTDGSIVYNVLLKG